MSRDPIVRRRKFKVAVAVLVVGLALSGLVALLLIYLARVTPGG